MAGRKLTDKQNTRLLQQVRKKVYAKARDLTALTVAVDAVEVEIDGIDTSITDLDTRVGVLEP